MNKMLRKLRVSSENASLLHTVYFSFFVSGFMCTLISAILPFMKTEYNMNYILSGAVLSAHQLGNLCAVFISGFLPYIAGRKKSAVFLSAGIVIGFMLIIITGNPAVLLVSFAAAGAGKGTMSNIANVVVAEVAENKTAGLNILHASFAAGALLSPFIAVAATHLLPQAAGWRTAAAMLVAGEIIAILFLARSSLSSVPDKKPEKSKNAFAKSPAFWLNTAILFFYLCCESAVVGWLVTYFKDSGIMPPALAQSSASMLWAMILAGRFICASLPAFVDKSCLILILAIIQICSFVLMITASSLTLVIAGLLAVGLGMSGMFPTTLSTMSAACGSSTVATGTCIACATVGAVLMPGIVGIAAEYMGITGGISTIGAAFGCMGFLSLIKLIFSRKKSI